MPLEGRQTLASIGSGGRRKSGNYSFHPTGVVAENIEYSSEWLSLQSDAVYARTIEINLDALEPQVRHSPRRHNVPILLR